MPHYRLLYVDDEPDNLFAFRAVFRRYYDVYTAESGEEALALLAEQEMDLVISDQRMPKMTGVELFTQIRKSHPEAIRMVMTGYSDMGAIIDAINEGNIYYYIAKPWKAESLRLIIDRALESRELKARNASLEKENVLAQFEILKNQINPHFLFNSMNVLNSLISRDQEKALRFSRRFSELYRKVLQLREQLLISLEEEMEFVDAFLDLQRIRFEEGLDVDITILSKAMAASLPPFALQTVVENAIKHNVVSAQKPLNVFIQSDGKSVVVSNNIQPRIEAADSTQTGLQNLRARYALLGTEEPSFEKRGNNWVASLPLVQAG